MTISKDNKDKGDGSPSCVSMEQGVTSKALPVTKLPCSEPKEIPNIQDTPEFSIPNFGQPDCECRHCQNNRASGGHKHINHGPYKPASELMNNELNRVSLPGDVDYKGVA